MCQITIISVSVFTFSFSSSPVLLCESMYRLQYMASQHETKTTVAIDSNKIGQYAMQERDLEQNKYFGLFRKHLFSFISIYFSFFSISNFHFLVFINYYDTLAEISTFRTICRNTDPYQVYLFI